jgi:hypothetical protein
VSSAVRIVEGTVARVKRRPKRVKVEHGDGEHVVGFEIREALFVGKDRTTTDYHWTAYVAGPA